MKFDYYKTKNTNRHLWVIPEISQKTTYWYWDMLSVLYNLSIIVDKEAVYKIAKDVEKCSHIEG